MSVGVDQVLANVRIWALRKKRRFRTYRGIYICRGDRKRE